MSDLHNDYGLLMGKDIKLFRNWFKEMTKLRGINCIYRAPKPGTKNYDRHGDLDADYEKPVVVGVIFENHPDQKTLKKMGWITEIQDSSSMIHVPYDLPGLERGALFIVPSGLDNAEGRLFRVINMQNIMMYPASIACEIAPEWEDVEADSTTKDFTDRNFAALLDNEEDD
jgi:hypothetical protein